MSVIMDVQFIFLLLLTSSSQAIIPASTIDSDATEIYNLNDVFMSKSPAIFHRSQSLVCEMINSCCPFIKPRLAEYVNSATTGDSNKLMQACMNNQPPQSFASTCPVINQFPSVYQNKDFQKYINVLTETANELEKPSITVQRPCSSDEAYATLCNWTQQNQIVSCERKSLQYVTQHYSDNDYQTFVRQTKSNFHLLIDAISKAFPTNNAAKTMSLICTQRTVQISFILLILLFPVLWY